MHLEAEDLLLAAETYDGALGRIIRPTPLLPLPHGALSLEQRSAVRTRGDSLI
jgi:hypothetical protein